MWFNRFCGVERRDFVRPGPGVGVNEVESWSILTLRSREVDLVLVLEPVPRVLEVDEVFVRMAAERVMRALVLFDTGGFGDIF